MERCEIIKRQLKKVGNTVYLKDGEWISMPFKAVISKRWKKKHSNFEHGVTEIGEVANDYYYFIGPYDHDITVLTENCVLLCDGEEYEFKHREPTSVNDDVLYYSGIVRKLRMGDYDEA